MAKANKTSFKKGQVANPKGRAKGSINESTKLFSKFKSLAIERYQEAFDLLWSNMKNGEGWAYQIYFKDIMPKKVYQPTILVQQQEGQPRLEALTTAISGFIELTHSEVLDEIKVLKSIELEEKKNEAEDCSGYTDEEIRTMHDIEENAKKRKLSYQTPV